MFTRKLLPPDEDVYRIVLKFEIKNSNIYKVDHVNVSVRLNYQQAIGDVEIKKKREGSGVLEQEVLVNYVKNRHLPIGEVPLVVNFYILHEEFYKINFYEYSENLLI